MADEARNTSLAWIQGLENPGGKFTLGVTIGSGDSSLVRQGSDADGKAVAIKIQEESEDTVQSIYDEFQILSEVCVENTRFPVFLGAYRTVETMPHHVWFVMELCEEGSVKDLLLRLKSQERFMKEDIISYILREVLLGLNELHERSIIHRDLKAANILISSNGDIKICDFGFARHVGTPQGKIQTVIGSPYWIAPEVVVSERHVDLAYDTRADVWSLGITGLEIGDCLDHAMAHVYAPRALFQVVQNPPPALLKPSDWSQLYNDFISECLEKNPDHRPWSEELVEHPFINQVPEQEHRIRGGLLHLLNELKSYPLPEHEPEVTVKSEMIKMDRSSAPQPMFRDDLATLYTVTEESVLETLSQRFAQGNIYTFLGDILIVINPFHEHPIYGSEVANKYKFRARCDNLPHIYAVGDRAYQDMLHHQEVQNIILTGETGSGKTTAGKHLLWHLSNMSASNKTMVERLLYVPMIMEAFGNATTIFNPNSTRHIQYFELTFTKTGKLSGGIYWAYCLEKWRVTNCGRNQSNFHIFYYLMDTLSATDQAKKYHLEKGKNYEYLPASPSHTPQDNIDKFGKVKDAFNRLDFSLEEQDTIVKILSAILLMGQIHFAGEDAAEIQNPEVVEKIAELLQVDDKKLIWTFTNYCVVTGGELVRGKNNFDEAEETRDSLARSLYCRLVDWIVNLINTKLSFTRLVFGDQHGLGILDIPGFECFAQDNTLDQFLVNMTNEQMQFFYNQRVFIWEMRDYEKDQLGVSGFNFHDNQEMLDIVLSKPKGLLAFLDDETKSSGNDHKHFLDQIESKLETRCIQITDANNFTVLHYSGQVIYDARNFVERNKNFLSPEVIQVLRDSGNPTITTLFFNQLTKTGNLTIAEEDVKQSRWTSAISAKPHQNKKFNTKSRGKYSQSRQMQTIAATMRNSLLEMLQKVSEGSAHFVRCLRSNLKCTPFSLDRDLVRYQLRALGMMDTLRARQLGYSRRLKFSEFLRRYKFLAFDFDESVEETKDNCRLLLIRLKMEGWALGESKVFLKYYNEEFLSRLYENQVHKVVKIQSLMRAFLARKKTNKFPRLAELRKQASESSDNGKGIGWGINKLANKGKVEKATNGRTSSPQDSKGLGIPAKNDYRRYGSRTTSSTPEPNPGYTKVFSSANVQSEFQNFRNTPNKPPRRSLSPPERDEIYERPASPRDIAKVFEAKSKENRDMTFGARYKPNISSGSNVSKKPISAANAMRGVTSGSNSNWSNKNAASSNDANVSQRTSSTPEIINPLEEFTNYNNKVMKDYDEPGPYNFKGMLRKTNIQSRDTAPLLPPQMPILDQSRLGKKVPDVNSNVSLQDQLPPKERTGHWSTNPYPLPGMAVHNSIPPSNNNPLEDSTTSSFGQSTTSREKVRGPTTSVTDRNFPRGKLTRDNVLIKSIEIEDAPQGIVFEGEAEDL